MVCVLLSICHFPVSGSLVLASEKNIYIYIFFQTREKHAFHTPPVHMSAKSQLTIVTSRALHFFFEFAWGFGIEKWQGCFVNLQWCLFPRKQSTNGVEKEPKNSRKTIGFGSSSTPFSTFWAPAPTGPDNPSGPNDPCSRSTESQGRFGLKFGGRFWTRILNKSGHFRSTAFLT